MHTTVAECNDGAAAGIPEEACGEPGVAPGDAASGDVDGAARPLTPRFPKDDGRAYRRHRRMSMEEFAAGWDGGETETGEWGGADVGAEAGV